MSLVIVNRRGWYSFFYFLVLGDYGCLENVIFKDVWDFKEWFLKDFVVLVVLWVGYLVVFSGICSDEVFCV